MIKTRCKPGELIIEDTALASPLKVVCSVHYVLTSIFDIVYQ